MTDLAKLRSLAPRDRRLLALSIVALPLIDAGVRMLGVGRTRTALERLPLLRRRTAPAPESDAFARARHVARLVSIAARRGPIEATCLRRALLLSWLLRREGIDSVMKVGVRRGESGLEAHAWIEHRGRPIDDDPSVTARYAPFDGELAARPDRA
jgi:hypothetical protein